MPTINCRLIFWCHINFSAIIWVYYNSDHLNVFFAFQSRGIYETPGVHVLQTAHTDLEIFCLDKEVLRIKQHLKERLSDYIYNGFWFSPEADYLRKCLSLAQEPVNGSVKLELFKGNGTVCSQDNSVTWFLFFFSFHFRTHLSKFSIQSRISFNGSTRRFQTSGRHRFHQHPSASFKRIPQIQSTKIKQIIVLYTFTL